MSYFIKYLPLILPSYCFYFCVYAMNMSVFLCDFFHCAKAQMIAILPMLINSCL